MNTLMFLSWGPNLKSKCQMLISLVTLLNAKIFVINMTFSTSMEDAVYKMMISGYSYHITLISNSSFYCLFICICTTIKYCHAFINNKTFESKCHLPSIKTNEFQILSKNEKALEQK